MPVAFAMPFLQSGVDAISEATPLAQMKFENEVPVVYDLLMGSTAGSLGETSALLIVAGGLCLASGSDRKRMRISGVDTARKAPHFTVVPLFPVPREIV